ncbi:MAG: FAD:protein FMN transferase [Tannerella sp.]|nr:FAD:protein FMN transferase [Tannerella sp.]
MNKSMLFLLSMFILTSCKQPKVYYEESGTVFHTFYQIKYQSEMPLSKKIDAELQAFDLSLNPFNPHSLLAKVNRNEAVDVDQWFADVFNKSQEVAERSGGMFDPTAAPFINLWGFGFERLDSVSQQVIDSLKTFVGYRKVRLEGTRIVKDDPRVLLNYSAIAKGYASHVIAALLEREGVENYMVEIGGEIAVKGVNPNGNCWQIAVSKPEDDSTMTKNEIQDTFALCDQCGFATSGNYRNFYVKDGKKYAHTINPHTGYPSEQNILSATVVAQDCMTADAYATAFMAMGLEQAVCLADQIPSLEYYLIYTDSIGRTQIRMSERIGQMLVKKQ